MVETDDGLHHDRIALILYGSETGNSQDVAEELGRVTQRLHFQARVCEMDQVDLKSLLKYTIVLFVVGTTGQGEFPKNSRHFWKSLLRKRLPPDCLNHVCFTTFGLGDSSYPKFNWAARKLHKRLEQLGASEVYPRGEADEQHQEGIDGTFLSWSADLGKHLLSSYPLPSGVAEIPADVLLPPAYTLELLKDSTRTAESSVAAAEQKRVTASSDAHVKRTSFFTQPQNRSVHDNLSSDNLGQSQTPPNMRTNWAPDPEYETDVRSQLKAEVVDYNVAPADNLNIPPKDLLPIADSFQGMLIKNERVTPKSHWQDVRLLTFAIPAENEYHPGDTVTIFPKNFPEDVQTLIDLQGWNDVADLPLIFEVQGPKYFNAENLVPIPPGLVPLENSTLRQLLLHNLDIMAIPKRHFFHLIAHHTDDPLHKERLLEFTNPMYSDEFFDYTTRPRRSILEVLQDFSSVKLPWRWATSLFPVIRGRQFSICSGGAQRASPELAGTIKLQLLVAIVKYQTVLKKIRQGLCSRYIASLPEGSILSMTMPPNVTFYKAIKINANSPVIMVGPGTGVAPCRSLIWQRAYDGLPHPDRIQEAVLFFGNRNKSADYFFQDEWKVSSLRLQVFAAFSRDQKEKIYVQDLIRREGKLIHRLLAANALIIVCGSSGKMPLQVREAFMDVMEEHGGPWENRKKVEECFEFLEKRGQYLQETW